MFVSISTFLAPAAGENDVTVGGLMSGVGVGVGVGVGILGLPVRPHPEWSRIELTTASARRTPKTLA
jgi:hypothetical protein